MTGSRCAHPIPPADLLAYWLGEQDPAREAQADEHLLGCGDCSARLRGLVDLAGAVRDAVRSGAVEAVLPASLVAHLAAAGARLREYRVAPNGSVQCTVAPEDDLLITRLEAPLADVERLDLERAAGDAVERLHDVPFDPAAGEVVLTARMDRVRALPATTVRMRLLAVAASGERVIGEYLFHHTPHRAGGGA
ncbi:MAG: hypothetical protein JNM90_20420 [Burkholderiales bacterium]|nr:hypothetical protein [Burkholderiales bacterium]